MRRGQSYQKRSRSTSNASGTRAYVAFTARSGGRLSADGRSVARRRLRAEAFETVACAPDASTCGRDAIDTATDIGRHYRQLESWTTMSSERLVACPQSPFFGESVRNVSPEANGSGQAVGVEVSPGTGSSGRCHAEDEAAIHGESDLAGGGGVAAERCAESALIGGGRPVVPMSRRRGRLGASGVDRDADRSASTLAARR